MEFETFNLTDLYTISSGLSKNRKYFGTGTPFLTFKDVFDNLILPNEFSGQVITEEKEREKYSVKKGDLFLTRTSEKQNELGISAVALKDYKNATFNGFTKRLRPNKYCENKLLPVFAAFYFRSNNFRNQVNSMSIMSTRASLNNEMISKLKITIPSFQNQMKISHILLALLKKEKINQKIIANLEELSQTLFKRWFVDFEFPDENGNPYKSSGGEMVDSELGKIPKYWKVSNLDKIASFVSRGITPKYNENSDIQIPIINQKVNKGPRLDLQYIKYFDGQNRIKKELYAQKNDLLLNSLGQGTLGRIHLFTRKSEEFLIDQHISIIRFDNINYSYFYYAHINTDLIQGQIDSLISGSTGMLMLNITKIRNLKVILPTEELVLKYSKLVNEYFGKITQLIYENENLTQLRDALLPKLMSGEIDIPDDIEVNEDELSI